MMAILSDDGPVDPGSPLSQRAVDGMGVGRQVDDLRHLRLTLMGR
jgi:hypothetical protein